MYWSKCDYCGVIGTPVKTCVLHVNHNVCPLCCIICPERGHCSKPAWYPQVKAPRRPVKKVEEEKIKAVMKDLLERFG